MERNLSNFYNTSLGVGSSPAGVIQFAFRFHQNVSSTSNALQCEHVCSLDVARLRVAGVQSQEYGTIDRDVVERVTDCQMKELVTIGLFTWLTTERSTYWPAPCFLLMLIRFL